MTGPPTPVPRWRRVVRITYLVLVVGAFTIAVVARREDLGQQLSSMDLLPVAGAALAGLGGVGVSGLVWRRMLAGLGSDLPIGPASRVFFLAQLGKYLPGSLWPVVAQAELGRDHGVPRRSAVAAQTLFMWVHLVTGAILGMPVLAVVGILPSWTAVAALLLIGLLIPRPLVAMMDALLRRFDRTPLPARPSGTDMLVASGWALLMWALYGLHIHLAIDALEFPAPGPLPWLVATGVFAAAWSAGFVFLIAPAGAGARELVLIAGLSAAVTAPETAFTVTLLSRLLLTVADGLWGAAGWALGGVSRRRQIGSDVHAGADGGPGDG